MHRRIAIPGSAERRIRREARSAILRERALALRQVGWTYAAIGQALGVSLTRAFQLVRKAERLICERSSKEGTPVRECPLSDSDDPLAAGRNNHEQAPWYPPADA
jgi:hypothetical protein